MTEEVSKIPMRIFLIGIASFGGLALILFLIKSICTKKIVTESDEGETRVTTNLDTRISNLHQEEEEDEEYDDGEESFDDNMPNIRISPIVQVGQIGDVLRYNDRKELIMKNIIHKVRYSGCVLISSYAFDPKLLCLSLGSTRVDCNNAS